MKILIAGDISTINIKNFSIKNINPSYKKIIKEQDLVLFNLEGPIVSSQKKLLVFRENRIKNDFLRFFNFLNNKISGKSQVYVSSNDSLIKLLKINRNTVVTLANNHIKDYGKDGFLSTKKKLAKNKIGFFGAGENLSDCRDFEYGNIIFININIVGNKKCNIPIGLYSATQADFGANNISVEKLSKKIALLKRSNKKIILIIHGGKEMVKEESSLGINLKKIRSLGADIVVIHHPHVYLKTKYEKYNIFFLGDFIFKQEHLPNNRESALLKVYDNGFGLKTELIRFNVCDIYKYE
ncbi:MAG: CapA family protein [Candidatus Pacebacteria bacterium]|nr:CapA family protein [Candidatus Paceibacterota bacterium]